MPSGPTQVRACCTLPAGHCASAAAVVPELPLQGVTISWCQPAQEGLTV